MNSRIKKLVIVPACLAVFSAAAIAAGGDSANGNGQLEAAEGKRHFAFSAHVQPDGTVVGNAVLHNPDYTGIHGNQPYALQIDITCMNRVGNEVFFGGTTQRTNDPSLVDAVFFSVQDNGEPGKNTDQISRAYFWDDDPNTTGDPQACMLNVAGDFPLETIIAGNIQVK